LRITLRHLRKWAHDGQKFPVLTCYDATSAKWIFQGGVHVMLVGDTAAQMILGHDSTLPATMPFMLEITGAVRRGAPDAHVMADMPFGSYHAGDDAAVANAVDFMARAGADTVKLEVEAYHGPLVHRMAAAGIPVVAHIGSRPQQVRSMGGFHSVGRTQVELAKIVEMARMMVGQGASMLLVEAVPAEVIKEILAKVSEVASGQVPLIGCGAGPDCHGHVVVLHDLLGLTEWQPPFAPPSDHFGKRLQDQSKAWADKVQSGAYLKNDHPYKMRDGV
jgi:3-methyl-2-oxobutanoate hydroxymethyltransferase